MRWNQLFDDLEGQLERELAAEQQDLAVDEERHRLGRLCTRDRLRALHDASCEPVVITLTTGLRLQLALGGVGRDWVSGELIEAPVRRARCVVPLASIVSIAIAPSGVAVSLAEDARAEASLSLRLGLPVVLRDLCRRRAAVELVGVHGTTRGTIDRVGHDHLDLAVHEPGSPRRAGQIAEVLVVPFASLVLVFF